LAGPFLTPSRDKGIKGKPAFGRRINDEIPDKYLTLAAINTFRQQQQQQQQHNNNNRRERVKRREIIFRKMIFLTG
jgi:hypothetical protein